jgi:hypothetical protein
MLWLRRTLVLLTALAIAPTARAEPPRIATLEQDPALTHSIGVALASWSAEVVPVRAERPGPDMTDAISSADRIARDATASALLWIARGGGAAESSCSLWVYDPRTRQITVRPLADCPPYDDATSAAVALTVKTVLRDVLASTAPAPAEPVQRAPAHLAPPPPPSPPPKHTARVEAYVAGRFPTHAADPVEARFGLEAAYFPLWFRGYAGVAASFDAGPSVDVSRPGVFTGTYSDVTTGVMVRGRIPLRTWLWLELGLGPGLHFTTLDGSSPSGDVLGHVNRTDVSLDVMVGVEAAWKWLRVGPFLGTSFMLQSQRYFIDQDLVLDVPTAQLQLGLRLGVELP